MCGVQEGSIFCLINAIAIAEYKTVVRNNGAIDTNVAWSQVYAVIAFWFGKTSSGYIIKQYVLLPLCTNFSVKDRGMFITPAKSQVEMIDTMWILVEISLCFIGKTTATNPHKTLSWNKKRHWACEVIQLSKNRYQDSTDVPLSWVVQQFSYFKRKWSQRKK